MILNEKTSKDKHTHTIHTHIHYTHTIHTIHSYIHTYILVKEKLEHLEDSSVSKVLIEFKS